jgi:hypothetical protein
MRPLNKRTSFARQKNPLLAVAGKLACFVGVALLERFLRILKPALLASLPPALRRVAMLLTALPPSQAPEDNGDQDDITVATIVEDERKPRNA